MDSHEYVKKLMEPQSIFPDLENKEKQKVRLTIDNVGEFDALQISVRIGKDGICSKIGIETWLPDYIKKYPEERKYIVDCLISSLNDALDEAVSEDK
jgi:hypothetical protein